MNTLLNWIDNRSGLIEAGKKCLDRPIPQRAGWCHVLPSTILFTFFVQAVTGFVIWMYYSPSSQTAWESVYFLQHEVSGGWLLRAVHHYAAQVMLVLIGAYLLGMIGSAKYRAPREFVFWITVLMGIFCLCLMLTGDLLAWDQNSYYSTLARVKFLNLLPIVGGDLLKVASGGPGFGHLTLTRFTALHVGLFGGGMLVLIVLRGLMARRADLVDTTASDSSESNETAWPDQTLRNTVACLGVMVVVLGLSLAHGVSAEHGGVELGAPADPNPANAYAAARPEWAFRGLYAFSQLFSGEVMILPIFVIPGILMTIVFLMPFIGRVKVGHYFNVAFTAVVLSGLVVLSGSSYEHDRESEEFQKAVASGTRDAARTKELIQVLRGIPEEGALSLLQNDPKTQGPALFERHCVSCHDYVDAEGRGLTATRSDDPNVLDGAPNLYGFASRVWIAGFLDPEKITSNAYFGKTKFRRGKMVEFVEEVFSDMEDEDLEDVQSLAMALSAEANLIAQRELDEKDAERIELGREFISDDFGCADCHKFHDKGGTDQDAPHLTGYGSPEWLTGIIADPTAKPFYKENNDRMPAYAAKPGDSPENLLTSKEIRMLVEWLRGEWAQKPDKTSDEQ